MPTKLGMAVLKAHAITDGSVAFCEEWSGPGFEVRQKLGPSPGLPYFSCLSLGIVLLSKPEFEVVVFFPPTIRRNIM